MSTVIEQRIHLTFIADFAQRHLFVCDLEVHRALAMPFPLLEATGILIPSLGINHCTLPIWLISSPFANVRIAVCIAHFTRAALCAGDEVTVVGVAGESDELAGTVSAAVDLVDVLIGVSEVGAYAALAEVGGIIETVELSEVFRWISTLALGFEGGNARNWFSHMLEARRKRRDILCGSRTALGNEDTAVCAAAARFKALVALH